MLLIFLKEMTVEWPGNKILSSIDVVQFRLKSGSGTVKYIFLERTLRLTAK